MINVCAILSLDRESKFKIQKLRDKITCKYKIPDKKLYPHITLAHYENINKNKIIKYSNEFINGISRFNIEYDSIELLSDNCIACVPKLKGKIVDLYSRYHDKYDSYCDKWTKKENGLWKPHSTIYASNDLQIKEMQLFLEEDFQPFKGEIIRFELSHIKNSSFEIIYSKDLV